MVRNSVQSQRGLECSSEQSWLVSLWKLQGDRFVLSSLSRRRFLQIGVGLAAAGAAASLIEVGVLTEPNHPKLVRIEIPLSRLPAAFDGFTIAQLSDFHYDEHFSIVPIRAAVEIVNQLQADLVVLTGDFITVPMFPSYTHGRRRAISTAGPCASLLAGLRSRLGILAVLGNHDADAGAKAVTEALEAHGISVLRNRSLPLERGKARFWVAGVDDIMDGDPDVDLTLRGIPPEEAVVALVHEPDFARQLMRYPVDLQLSGHSHGGQIWLPGIGAPWLPELARKYPRGLYRVGALTLYTNIGLGTIRLPIRLNCPPEITLFTLRSLDGNFQPQRS